MAFTRGMKLGPYEILEVAGSGGMGEVYRARDPRLGRVVAIKVLPEALLQDPGRRQRLEREARAISGLSHPHICTLHDVGYQDGVDFLVMEYLEGETLAARVQKGPLPLDQVLRLAVEIAGALDAAHRQGVVHRDLKPGNIMLTPSGAKLLDFGLAKIVQGQPPGSDSSAMSTVAREPETRTGVIVGTPAYMSPEQALSSTVDSRSDVFSFGLVLYEMVTGRRAFGGDSQVQVLAAILRDTPPPVRSLRPEAGGEIEQIVQRCLRKDPATRYPDAAALLADLRTCEAQLLTRSSVRNGPRRGLIFVAVSIVVLAAVGFAAWSWRRTIRERWARRIALPEIARLAEADQLVAAFRLAHEAEPQLKGDPQFDLLWRDVSAPASLSTLPAGAEVFIRDYGDPNAAWNLLGVTPLENVRVPRGQLRWKILKEGFEPVALAFAPPPPPSVTLVPAGQAPAGMVLVAGGRAQYRATRGVELGDYWLDRFEVTNREYQGFVDRGGYRTPEYWKHPFVKGERTLAFDDAMALMKDSTGRPGPSTWELGAYPEGQADLPVGGVSWYEASAYAEFAGKSLPTFQHWFRAAGADDRFSDILRLSNFRGAGPTPSGSMEGQSPWGAYDMAGNVREWVWNAAGARRYTLGGAWSDPTYLFTGPDAVDPFDRNSTQGFRCALYPAPPPAETFGSIETIFRDYSKEVPVGDAIFTAYRDLHRYDPGPLEARTESVESGSEYWSEERVSFAAAYGGERVPATLFLPKNTAPPYQAVLYFPPGSSLRLDSIRNAGTRQFVFLIRSGRAVLFPSYKGTFERRLPPGAGGRAVRDNVIQWSKDVGRSIDYLQSRPDIDGGRIAFYGQSMGAAYGPIAGAVETRFRTLVLVGGGLDSEDNPAEIDAINFAPRVRVPVLMINGRYDFIFPLDVSQEPLFRLFTLPEHEKRHYVFDGGHVPPRLQEIARESLDWLDRHLGPVRTTGTE